MVCKWIHINFDGDIPWANRIWTEYNKAHSVGAVPKIPEDARELAIHLSTRLNMLPHVIKRLNTESRGIYDHARNAPNFHKFEPGKQGTVLDLDESLRYHFLLDLDSLLFELTSCCELIMCFFGRIKGLGGDPIDESKLGKSLQKIVKDAGKDVDWFVVLDNHRNLFIHKATPYFAIDVTDESKLDILIMKENLVEFSGEDRFIRLSDLEQIVQGFGQAIWVLQEYLVNFLANLVRARNSGG